MPLTDEQQQRIQRLVNDEWETEDEFAHFFSSVTDTEELQQFADGFNWDCGFDELRAVIEHPLCDQGTALLIYWRGQPGYFLRYRTIDETPAHARDQFAFLQEIEQRVRSGQYLENRFPYDPRNDRGHDVTPRPSELRHSRQIPPEMGGET
jgi:hypothetical protein